MFKLFLLCTAHLWPSANSLSERTCVGGGYGVAGEVECYNETARGWARDAEHYITFPAGVNQLPGPVAIQVGWGALFLWDKFISLYSNGTGWQQGTRPIVGRGDGHALYGPGWFAICGNRDVGNYCDKFGAYPSSPAAVNTTPWSRLYYASNDIPGQVAVTRFERQNLTCFAGSWASAQSWCSKLGLDTIVWSAGPRLHKPRQQPTSLQIGNRSCVVGGQNTSFLFERDIECANETTFKYDLSPILYPSPHGFGLNFTMFGMSCIGGNGKTSTRVVRCLNYTNDDEWNWITLPSFTTSRTLSIAFTLPDSYYYWSKRYPSNAWSFFAFQGFTGADWVLNGTRYNQNFLLRPPNTTLSTGAMTVTSIGTDIATVVEPITSGMPMLGSDYRLTVTVTLTSTPSVTFPQSPDDLVVFMPCGVHRVGLKSPTGKSFQLNFNETCNRTHLDSEAKIAAIVEQMGRSSWQNCFQLAISAAEEFYQSPRKDDVRKQSRFQVLRAALQCSFPQQQLWSAISLLMAVVAEVNLDTVGVVLERNDLVLNSNIIGQLMTICNQVQGDASLAVKYLELAAKRAVFLVDQTYILITSAASQFMGVSPARRKNSTITVPQQKVVVKVPDQTNNTVVAVQTMSPLLGVTPMLDQDLRYLSSVMVSVQFYAQGEVLTLDGLPSDDPLIVRLPHRSVMFYEKPTCVFLTESSSSSTSRFDSAGCQTNVVSSTVTDCVCNHSTVFFVQISNVHYFPKTFYTGSWAFFIFQGPTENWIIEGNPQNSTQVLAGPLAFSAGEKQVTRVVSETCNVLPLPDLPPPTPTLGKDPTLQMGLYLGGHFRYLPTNQSDIVYFLPCGTRQVFLSFTTATMPQFPLNISQDCPTKIDIDSVERCEVVKEWTSPMRGTWQSAIQITLAIAEELDSSPLLDMVKRRQFRACLLGSLLQQTFLDNNDTEVQWAIYQLLTVVSEVDLNTVALVLERTDLPLSANIVGQLMAICNLAEADDTPLSIKYLELIAKRAVSLIDWSQSSILIDTPNGSLPAIQTLGVSPAGHATNTTIMLSQQGVSVRLPDKTIGAVAVVQTMSPQLGVRPAQGIQYLASVMVSVQFYAQGDLLPLDNLPADDPLIIQIPHRPLMFYERPNCVFLTESLASFDSAGCMVNVVSNVATGCVCNHATVFSVQISDFHYFSRAFYTESWAFFIFEGPSANWIIEGKENNSTQLLVAPLTFSVGVKQVTNQADDICNVLSTPYPPPPTPTLGKDPVLRLGLFLGASFRALPTNQSDFVYFLPCGVRQVFLAPDITSPKGSVSFNVTQGCPTAVDIDSSDRCEIIKEWTNPIQSTWQSAIQITIAVAEELIDFPPLNMTKRRLFRACLLDSLLQHDFSDNNTDAQWAIYRIISVAVEVPVQSAQLVLETNLTSELINQVIDICNRGDDDTLRATSEAIECLETLGKRVAELIDTLGNTTFAGKTYTVIVERVNHDHPPSWKKMLPGLEIMIPTNQLPAGSKVVVQTASPGLGTSRTDHQKTCEIGPVMASVQIFAENGTELPLPIFSEPLLSFNIPHRTLASYEESRCMFFEGEGLSQRGCKATTNARNSNISSSTTCACNHATFFTVIFNELSVDEFTDAHKVNLVAVIPGTLLCLVYGLTGLAGEVRERRRARRFEAEKYRERRARERGQTIPVQPRSWLWTILPERVQTWLWEKWTGFPSNWRKFIRDVWKELRSGRLISVVSTRYGDPFTARRRLACVATCGLFSVTMNGLLFNSDPLPGTTLSSLSSFVPKKILSWCFQEASTVGLPWDYMVELKWPNPDPQKTKRATLVACSYALSISLGGVCLWLIAALSLKLDPLACAEAGDPQDGQCFCHKVGGYTNSWQWLWRCLFSLII